MGGSWSLFSSNEVEEEKSIKVVVAGRLGAGKSHFLEKLEGSGVPPRPTQFVQRFNRLFYGVRFYFVEIGEVHRRRQDLHNTFVKNQDCGFFFLDPGCTADELMESKQQFLLFTLDLPRNAPVCIVFSVRPPEEIGENYEFPAVERVFQLHIVARTHPIIMVLIAYDSMRPLEYMLEWTLKKSNVLE